MDKSKILLKILKENLVYVLPFLLVLLLFVNFVVPEFFKNIEAFKRMNETDSQYEQVKTQYDMLKAQQEMQNRQKKVIKDGKIVFDAPDMRFSPDASFAPLFELVLTILGVVGAGFLTPVITNAILGFESKSCIKSYS